MCCSIRPYLISVKCNMGGYVDHIVYRETDWFPLQNQPHNVLATLSLKVIHQPQVQIYIILSVICLRGRDFWDRNTQKSFRICKISKSSGLGWVDCGVHTELLIQHERLHSTLAFGMTIFSCHWYYSTKVKEKDVHTSSLCSRKPFLVMQITVIYFTLKYFHWHMSVLYCDGFDLCEELVGILCSLPSYAWGFHPTKWQVQISNKPAVGPHQPRL